MRAPSAAPVRRSSYLCFDPWISVRLHVSRPSPGDGRRHEHPRPERALVEEPEPVRPESIEPVRIEPDATVVGEPLRVERLPFLRGHPSSSRADPNSWIPRSGSPHDCLESYTEIAAVGFAPTLRECVACGSESQTRSSSRLQAK